MSAAPTTVDCRGLTKRFGGTTALDAVSVEFVTGRVHALVGENGAGKSTLGKVLAGVHTSDVGEILIDGQRVSLRTPKSALGHGITMVAQELSLVPGRSVLDNVFLGSENSRFGIVDRKAMLRRFEALVDDFGVRVDPHAQVADLSIAQQQSVEILRALARDARVIVMDEPTARLSHHEALALGRHVRALADRGVGVIYVSHFLDEILAIADVVTVLRNGRLVRTGPVASETKSSLIEGVAGRTLGSAFPPRQLPERSGPPLLELDGLTRDGVFENISFDVHPGEIVTLAGLVGSGRTEVMRAIFGADPATSGSIRLAGDPFRPTSPSAAIRAGIAMVPESRRTQGLFLGRRVLENVSLPHLDRFSRGSLIRHDEERDVTNAAAADVHLRGATVDSLMNELSGGNQQKTLFARWTMDQPRLFIADEPTRGVDVGAKRAIYELIVELAANGMAVIVVSSELEEVLGLAHKILVMRSGELVGELEGATAQEADVMRLAFGAAA